MHQQQAEGPTEVCNSFTKEVATMYCCFACRLLLAAWCLQGSDCSCCSRLVLKLTVCSHAELWRQLLVGWDDVQGQWPGTSGPYHAGSQHLGGPPLEACKMVNIHYSQTSLTQALVTAKPH